MISLRPVIKHLPDYIIAVVLAAVPFYAFLTVLGANIVGHYTLLRLWPEALLFVLLVLVVVQIARTRTCPVAFRRNLLFRHISAYSLLLVLLACAVYLQGNVSPKALLFGVLVDVRFLVWFVLVWFVAEKSPWLLRHWQQLVLIPLAVVASFAVLQFFVLPPDFLAHFGYDKQTTIPPAQTINQDTHTIRAQSFLRGPNQLGAYLVVAVSLLPAAAILWWQRAALIGASLLTLLLSFSRSAWLGLMAAGGAFAATVLSRVRQKQLLAIGLVAVVLAGGLIYAFRNNGGVQNALFHVDSTQTSAAETSNGGHIEAIHSAIDDIAHEPLGRGPGTAGPASTYNTEAAPRNSESFWLNTGQELGVVGLALFVAITVSVSLQLYRKKTMLAYGLLASGIGVACTNVFAYAWFDPTLSYLWWGLAAIVLASSKQKVVS